MAEQVERRLLPIPADDMYTPSPNHNFSYHHLKARYDYDLLLRQHKQTTELWQRYVLALDLQIRQI